VEFAPDLPHNVQEVSKDTYDANGSKPLANGFFVDSDEVKQITFDKPGSYYFVCTPHAGMGMKGKIIVK